MTAVPPVHAEGAGVRLERWSPPFPELRHPGDCGGLLAKPILQGLELGLSATLRKSRGCGYPSMGVSFRSWLILASTSFTTLAHGPRDHGPAPESPCLPGGRCARRSHA
jgi:hypothetical protein